MVDESELENEERNEEENTDETDGENETDPFETTDGLENLEDEISFPVYDGECKLFRQEPYHTPNNYDLTFDHNNIPSNIQVETASALQYRLQKLMPTSKIIHISLGENQLSQTNFLRINSRMKVNNQEVNFR